MPSWEVRGCEVHALEGRLQSYLDRMTHAMSRREQRQWAGFYLRGLLLDGERKSIAPLAQRTGGEVQSLQQFIGQSPWSASEVQHTLNAFMQEQLGAPTDWIIDETGFPKQGTHSVGVARQYCGSLGKRANCQMAVSLHARYPHSGWPLGWRLYLPESWTQDPERCRRAGVPAEVGFKPKTDLALDLIAEALAQGMKPGVILADHTYGRSFLWRRRLLEWALSYCVGVDEDTAVWTEAVWQTQCQNPTGRLRKRPPRGLIVSLKSLAQSLPAKAWHRVTWAEGSRGTKRSRFALVAVRAAHRKGRDEKLPRWREYALMEWPAGEPAPTRYWLGWWQGDKPTLVQAASAAKGRSPIEQDYRELKDELGLDHFEGRSWVGWHHHVAMVTLAFAFLRLEQRRLEKKPDCHVADDAAATGPLAHSAGRLLPLVSNSV